MFNSHSVVRRGLAIAIAVMAFASPFSQAAFAAWPDGTKPIKLVVGFPPGGGVDTLARSIAQPLADALKGTVMVENRPGAGGLIATEQVAKSTPDGYTLYMASPGSFTIWPNLRSVPYDPQNDFAPVSVLVTMPNLLVLGANAPYKDVAEIIAAGKAPGSKLSYASGGNGTIGHIAGEQFNMLAGTQIQHVAYKGTAPALTDVIAGVVPFTFSDPSARQLIAAGKLRAFAVTTPKRSAIFPNLPTMAESGVAGYDVTNWYGLVAPAGTPADVIATLSSALAKVMARPDVKQQLEKAGMEATSSSPAQFGQLMNGERTKWGNLIRKANIKAD